MNSYIYRFSLKTDVKDLLIEFSEYGAIALFLFILFLINEYTSFSLKTDMRMFCMKFFKELVSNFSFTYQRSNFIIILCAETLGDFYRHLLIKTLSTIGDFHHHSHQNTNMIFISFLN